IDAWVYACAGQLRVFLDAKTVTPATVATYWVGGLLYFFRYLIACRGPTEPGLLEPRHIRAFIAWLAEQGWKPGAQKAKYSHTKAVLTALVRRGVIPSQEGLFPSNPYPRSNSLVNGASPLSMPERERLALALRDDLVAMHHGQFQGVESQALVVYLLALALRCGANPTPLLEAERDCLEEHPFMPNMKRLRLFKRRGNATKIAHLRSSKKEDYAVSVPLDGVALIQKALQATAPLVAQAQAAHRNRLWLCRSASPQNTGEVVPLSGRMLDLGIAALVDRHDLKGDDGERLRLNLSRLRKTVEMRLYDLSGGDVIATAALMGHAPQVADVHYLACTQQMRENATFVGEALPDIYERGLDASKVIPILPGKTPTGRCKDPYQGDKAPKDGSACDAFFSCFACTSYAITGSPDDLHRLFSFYFFLELEMNKARTDDWRSEFRNTMLLIDRFTADKFDPEVVRAARERARVEPLRFWASYALTEPKEENSGDGSGDESEVGYGY
ncbi:MAG: hypothetical protein EBR49_18750, partial [Betaproteobacteria bacterium]|nr:hypothetical protein [Betaproteobacteria bacterium]